MKRLLILVAAVVLAPGAVKNPRLAYIERYSSLAVSEMQRTGVPASITLAQALVESGAGSSPLAVHANNHFGLKCHDDWTGEKYFQDDDRKEECFRAFASVEDSYRAHSDFLRGRERYKTLFELDPTDYVGWAKGLRRAGYATDAGYASKLINVIEDFQLYRFDRETPVGVPSPREQELELQAASEPAAGQEPEAAKELAEPVQDYRESGSVSLARPVYKENGVPYVRAVEGETLQSIADEYGLFLRQLLRYNDLGADRPLAPGTRVYLARKKAQCAQAGMYLVQRDGETLWEISQLFGVRLKQLQLYNVFRGAAPLEAGDTVILRKL